MTKEISRVRVNGAICYLGWWITGLFFLITEKKESYIRFHAMQSVIVFGSLTIFRMLVMKVIPFISEFVSQVFDRGFWTLSFILWLFLIWKAYSGEEYGLPYFGEAARKQVEKFSKYVPKQN